MKPTKKMTVHNYSKLSKAVGYVLAISACSSVYASNGLTSADTINGQEKTRYIVKIKDQSIANFNTNGLSPLQAKQQLFENTASQVNGEVTLALNNINAMALYLNDAQRKALTKNSDVEYIEIDPKRYLMAETTPYGITMVEAPQVPSVAGGGQKVCIVDTGYTISHQDLPSSGVTGYGTAQTGSWSNDGHGHGTHVAGTVAALGGNNIGVVGVNPKSLGLHIVKVFNDAGEWAFGSDLVAAIDSCRGAGAKVISMSLGGSQSSQAEQSAFNSANSQGILSIAAAGNAGNSSLSYPASYSAVMSVAAVDSSGNRASFSQYNNQVEIAAPGVNTNSTWNNGQYNSISGTSMATPHVSGVAALIWGNNKSCTNQQVRDAMNNTAQDRGSPGRDTSYGYGIVKAKQANDRLAQVCGTTPNDLPPEANFSYRVSDNSVSFSDSSTDDKGVTSWSWSFGDGATSNQQNPSHTYASTGAYQVQLTVTDTNNQTDSYTTTVNLDGDTGGGCDGLPAWSASTSYSLDDQVSYSGNKYTAIWWSTGAQPDIYSNVWRNDGECDGGTGNNQPPVANFEYSATALMVSFTSTSTDDKGVTTYAWDFGDRTSASTANPSHTYAAAGSYNVTLTVTDAEGLEDVFVQSVTVTDGNGTNQPPESSFTATTSDLTASFTNTAIDDKGIATYAWDFGDRTSSSSANPTHTYASAGTYNVTLTVTDEEGLEDEHTQPVTVTDGNGTNQPPVANFTHSANDLVASFTSTSTDDKGVVTYAWDFGDRMSSTSANPTHTYASAGTYYVTLTVTDAEGLEDEFGQSITVTGGDNGGGCTGVADWNANTTYQVGDKVKYQNREYEAIWWSRGASPAIYSNVWKDLGECR